MLVVVDYKIHVLTDATADRTGMKRAARGLSLLSLVLLSAYLLYVAKQIERQSLADNAQPADVIIVMGAAEYHGRPSQVLQGRLDHALALYRKNFAPYILTTGGAGGDPEFTEGGVGRAYLTKHGVRSTAILTESEGATTAQSLDSAAATMRRLHLHSCIVVSDGYHIYRVKRILQAQGLTVYGSPRPSPGSMSVAQLRWQYLKQAIGFALWQIGVSL